MVFDYRRNLRPKIPSLIRDGMKSVSDQRRILRPKILSLIRDGINPSLKRDEI